MSRYPLRIGSITLENNFESPDGNQGLGDFGSHQKAVVREFPGGYLSAQLFGSFTKPIHWTGKLIGETAVSRSFQLQALCDRGEEIRLSWGRFEFLGFVEDYKATIRGPSYIEYEIEFRPLDNLATVNGGGVPSPASNSMIVNAAQQTIQRQLPNSSQLPPSLAQNVNSFNSSLNQAMQQSGNSVAQIPQSTLSTLKNQINSLQSQLDPLLTSHDPLIVSQAADLRSSLGTLNNAFERVSTFETLTTIQAVSPNYYQLSAQFYGTPLLYRHILDANNRIDPLAITDGPIDVVIPRPPKNVALPVATVMRDGAA